MSTYGTGELIRLALDRGARKIILGLGGSATVDAGIGCLRALGMRFFDEQGGELAGIGADLGRIARIETEGLDPRLERAKLVIASDVRNPLLGPSGAVYVFGLQKGLRPDELPAFEADMSRYADLVRETTGRDLRDEPGAGAAGGFGFSMLSFFPQLDMRSGFELIAELGGLAEQMRCRCDSSLCWWLVYEGGRICPAQ